MSLDVWIREVVWTWEHISAWCSKRFVHVYVYKHKYAFIETHSEFKYLKTYLPVNASRCADLRSYLSVRIHICMMWQAFCPYRCVYIQMCIHIHATTQILNSNLQVIFTCKCHWMCGLRRSELENIQVHDVASVLLMVTTIQTPSSLLHL